MIRADSLQCRIGAFSLRVSLELAEGEYFVFLGSTGSGKTLLLECLCGLRDIDEGTVEFNGRDVTHAGPRMRGLGYVPQDTALFDHLDVRGNIAFSLKTRGLSRIERNEKARRIAGALGIEHLVDRKIRGLSGGERQRVALARALVGDPVLLVLDEPVSALDAFTRDAVCREIVQLNRATGVTVIHVCHSFEEARLVADRIGVIRNGRIVQTGTADTLMTQPASRYVANLLRLENIFTGKAVRTAGRSRIDVNGLRLLGPAASNSPARRYTSLMRERAFSPPYLTLLALSASGRGCTLGRGGVKWQRTRFSHSRWPASPRRWAFWPWAGTCRPSLWPRSSSSTSRGPAGKS